VVTGSAKDHGAGTQHQHGPARDRTFRGTAVKGKLVGFYAAEEFEGVISHPGDLFHVHYADERLKISGHLDSFGVRKGAALLLPKQ